MRRILVIGSGGAGKSTFARQLGRALRIEVIHLDSIYWSPGWVEMPKPEWRRVVSELLKRESWVMDGNYSGTFDLRLEACDTVVFLDRACSVSGVSSGCVRGRRSESFWLAPPLATRR